MEHIRNEEQGGRIERPFQGLHNQRYKWEIDVADNSDVYI